MNYELKLIKMIDGSDILAETKYDSDNHAMIFRNALKIKTIHVEEGDTTTSLPYFSGAKDDTFASSVTHIITLVEPTTFLTKFYGSSLFRFKFQQILRNSSNIELEEGELPLSLKIFLTKLKQDIIDTYGMIDETEFNFNSIKPNEVIH